MQVSENKGQEPQDRDRDEVSKGGVGRSSSEGPGEGRMATG